MRISPFRLAVWCFSQLCLLAFFSPSVAPVEAQNFTYQGFGATTPGGAGKPIVYVTNLNDSGTGSFRTAVSQGNRRVHFSVGGTITLASTVSIKGAFITIDGSTAPSPITLVNRGLKLTGNNGTHDVILKNLRIRNANPDGIAIRDGAYRIVIDHISTKGAFDGAVDVTRNAYDITVQWSIIAENNAAHNMLILIGYQARRVTFHHNLFVKGQSRNPQSGWDNTQATAPPDTVADIRNNLMWNFSAYGTTITDRTKANVINNYYYSASVTQADDQLHISGDPGDVYANGNYSLNGVNVDGEGNVGTPYAAPTLTTTDACTAAHHVKKYAGVRPLDAIDQKYLNTISLPAC